MTKKYSKQEIIFRTRKKYEELGSVIWVPRVLSDIQLFSLYRNPLKCIPGYTLEYSKMYKYNA